MATYPSAVRWNLASKDYDTDASTGEHVSEHPIDAAVAIRLGFRRGTIAGDPTTGNTYHEVNIGAEYDVRQRDVEDRTVASLGNLITDGLVQLRRVAHEVMPFGGLRVLVEYTNLRTGAPGKVASNG